ncbi:MAG: adenylate cyclase, partial [Saprospiraceae bacterium]
MNFLKSAKFKYNVGRILRIALFWSLGGAVDALLLYMIRDSFYFVATDRYIFLHHFLANVCSYFLVGLISGYLMVYWLRDRLRQLSFVANLLIQVVVMATVVMFLSIIMYTIFFSVVDELPMTHPNVLKSASELFLSSFNTRNTIFAFFLAIASVIFLNVNDKYGPGILSAYFSGKYHNPKQEERIFMFVDMKASTTIAEQIGNIKFHN